MNNGVLQGAEFLYEMNLFPDLEYTFKHALTHDKLGMCPLAAHCHLRHRKLSRKTGWLEQARTELSAAIELYRAMEMTFWLPEAETVLAEVMAS
jgi:hypothetical protein